MHQIEIRSRVAPKPSLSRPDVDASVILAIGRRDFSGHMSRALKHHVDHDIIAAYVIDKNRTMSVLFAEGGVPASPRFSKIAAHRYASDFWPQDPAVRRFLISSSESSHGMALQRWTEIPRGEYRAFAYERPNMLERLSFFAPVSGGGLLLSVYRTNESGQFSDRDLSTLERQSNFLIAATRRHWELVKSQSSLRPEIESITEQVNTWREDLSPREVQVCAALLAENSVKGAIHSTGLQAGTFATYRKRAFVKLAIHTRGQLRRLYEHRYSPV